jgi:hypothetical protein
MNHPAELALAQYMTDAANGKAVLSKATIERIGQDVVDALGRQFGGGNKRGDFGLRMSNIGRPSCQLWFQKNQPEKALPFPSTFVMNMMLGDIVEAIFKGLLTEAEVEYGDADTVVLDLPEQDTKIKGTYDITINGAVDDIKSASDWSYRNKFKDYATLKAHDSFGYVAQLAGYAKASGLKAGGWWVVNKANGSFKYVPATGLDMMEEMYHINTVKTVKENKFERCFDAVDETFNGKLTGNKILDTECGWCSFRKTCWPEMKELPALKSRAKEPKIVSYVHIEEESTV